MSAAALNPEKFSPFRIHSTSYKAVNEPPIGVDIRVPKYLKLGIQKHPPDSPLPWRVFGKQSLQQPNRLVILSSTTKRQVRSLTHTKQVTGASLLPLFFTNWILDLALLNGAIIVSADFRLLPEATGADISNQWDWGLVGLMDGHITSSRALAAIAYIDPAWYHRHGHIVIASSWRIFLGGAMAINMLPPQRPICFPLYSIRSQQEANSSSFFGLPRR